MAKLWRLPMMVVAILALAIAVPAMAGGFLFQKDLGSITVVAQTTGFKIAGDMGLVHQVAEAGSLVTAGTFTVTNLNKVSVVPLYFRLEYPGANQAGSIGLSVEPGAGATAPITDLTLPGLPNIVTVKIDPGATVSIKASVYLSRVAQAGTQIASLGIIITD